MVRRALPNARFSIEELPCRRTIHSTAGEPSTPFTKQDSRRKRREPSATPCCLLRTERVLRGAFVMYPPTSLLGGIDPKVPISLLSSTLHVSNETDAHRPRWTRSDPWLGPNRIHTRTDVASGSGYTREDAPFADVACALPRFLSPPTSRRRYGECQTHDTSRRHAVGPPHAETRADLQPLPWRDRRTFEWRALREEKRVPSARGAFHRVHRA